MDILVDNDISRAWGIFPSIFIQAGLVNANDDETWWEIAPDWHLGTKCANYASYLHSFQKHEQIMLSSDLYNIWVMVMKVAKWY